MAKLRTPTEELHTRLRELTEECRRLRRELDASTRERIAANGMANHRAKPVAQRRRQPKKSP